MDKKVTLAQLKEVVQEAYDQVKANTGGKNADYIPYLANVNKDLFGISVCLLNGQTIHVGDTDYRFGIESVSNHRYLVGERSSVYPTGKCRSHLCLQYGAAHW